MNSIHDSRFDSEMNTYGVLMDKIYKFTDTTYKNWCRTIWKYIEKGTYNLGKFRLLDYSSSNLKMDASYESIKRWQKDHATLTFEQVTQVCPVCWKSECPGFVKDEENIF